MGSRKHPRRARQLMVPVQAALGAGQSAAEALRRLEDQRVELAPVLEAGRLRGILQRDRLTAAVRFGLGDLPVRDLVRGEAPRVGAGVYADTARAALRGLAPAVLVKGHGGHPAGMVARRLLDGGWEDVPGTPTRRSGARRLRVGVDARHWMLLRAAAAAARARGEALYLVGGVVRDLLSGRPGRDLDLVVVGEAAGLARDLAASWGGRVVSHPRFLTASVLLPDGERVDIATARREIYAEPGALPEVRPASIEADLERRDVTQNAMAIRLDGPHLGALIDPLGGLGDRRHGLLRSHHLLSMTEDPTRAFRVARLASRLGCRLAPETHASLKIALEAGAFDHVSGERFMQELRLAAREPDPIASLRAMERMHILRALSPGGRLRPDLRLPPGAGVWRRLRPWDPAGPVGPLGGWPPAPLLLVLLLAAGSPPAARRRIARRLRLTGAALARFLAAPAATRRVVRALRARGGPEKLAAHLERVPPEALLLAAAQDRSRRALAVVRAVARARAVRSSVRGADLARMGLPPGPAYGAILKQLRAARITGVVRDDTAERLLAGRLVRSHRRHGPR